MSGMVASTQVDAYFAKAKRWRDESERLREILLGCRVDEALKWGKPCYAAEGKNIAIMQPMNAFLALLFFKGALLHDPRGLLQEQGENTQSARRLCFTSVREVTARRAAVKDLVRQAIALERAGVTAPKTKKPLVLAPELAARLGDDRRLKAAFEALTPGRQREYNLYVSGAKQSKTRDDRVSKCVPTIRAGKGLRDR
jgi:uncharacterized protein YdeI (YjbR/CyaY-like superfamily)